VKYVNGAMAEVAVIPVQPVDDVKPYNYDQQESSTVTVDITGCLHRAHHIS